MTELSEWRYFYSIAGSAAGALIGLQFVAMTLIAGKLSAAADRQTGAAFATPSVVHFGAVLLLSALLCAPWQSIVFFTFFLCAFGIIGTVYAFIVSVRMHRQAAYEPVFEDWLFHAILPCGAYLVTAISACTAFTSPRTSLFFIGGSALVILFVGIHNVWDAVVYHIFLTKDGRQE